ncbi:MAG: hypothetical protein L3K02_05560, partial [Thermoplasmata archaeon]|nr:hypothetical protein [Thermoplasmata archaeon]
MIPLLLSGLPVHVSGPASSAADSAVSSATGAASTPFSSSETVTIQNHTQGNLSNFWGVGVTSTVSLANFTNETYGTPVNWFVWPAGKIADTYNMTSGQDWTDGFATVQPANESQFVSSCEVTSCHAIFSVPGEIDSPSAAAYEVAYTEQVLGFHPAYWEVGNEPYGWQHFGKPWSQWSATDNLSVGPVGYAQVVQAYISAMRAVDPSARFIGLPGVGAGTKPDGPWLNATVGLNGPNLSAVGIHDYPGERGPPGGTLAQFFQSLTAPKSAIVTRISTDEQEVKAACPTCAPIQFFVDEFGAGTGQSGPWQPFMDTYPEVPFVTAELILMMESNVSNADLFSLRSGYNGSLFNANGLPFPLDSLYTQILPQFDPIALTTTVSGSVNGVFAAASYSPRSHSLTVLAVNTNTTQSVDLYAAGPEFPTDGTYSLWRANNSTTSPNGTFQHTSGYQSTPNWSLPPLGVLLVSVCRANSSAAFGGSSYAVAFCESGLPGGTNWSVTLGASTSALSREIISFAEPNGSYSYQLGPVPGWRTAVGSGSLTVAGAPAAVDVPWTAVTYPVTFTENGLPGGTNWSVTLGGTRLTSVTNTITTVEPNGTYPYVIGGIGGWTTSPYRGSVTVDITPVQLTVNWTRVLYQVTFHESGLPSGTPWSVDLGGTNFSSSTTSIKVMEPNGTYSYTVRGVPGYTPDTYSGSVTVKGSTPFVPISWAQNVFSVWFNETGLPSGTNWSATLNGTMQAGNASSFTFFEPNGTYAYSLAGTGWAPLGYRGNATVTGQSVTVSSSWTRVEYDVTFKESGLPFRTNWSVTLNGTTLTSSASSISFAEPNGSAYPYRVFGAPGYITTWLGSVTVNGTTVSVPVPWTVYYSTVIFNETGLPVSGSNWYANVTGRAAELIWTSLGNWTPTFPNGTYNYTVSTGWKGYAPTVSEGTFTVVGGPVVVVAAFVKTYSVTFTESGLPTGTNWTVSVEGVPRSTTATSLVLAEPSGNYSFQVGAVAGFLPTPANGSVEVLGGPVGRTVAWAPVASPGVNVTFTETGLPSGTPWSVSLGGATHHSSGSSLPFVEINGTYAYQVGAVSGWSPSPQNGSLTVNGVPLTIPIQWTHTGILAFSVNFTETGLPAGTLWSVTLHQSTDGSRGPFIEFTETNGSFAFQVGAVAGWNATPDSGTVTVVGRALLVSIFWSPASYSVTFTASGLP